MKLKKVVKKIRAGKMAIEKNNLTDLRNCLRYCFPMDPEPAGGNYNYYFALEASKNEWDCGEHTRLPTIKSTSLWNKIQNKESKKNLKKNILNIEERVEQLEQDLETILKTLRSSTKIIEGLTEVENENAKRIDEILSEPKEVQPDSLPEGWKMEELVPLFSENDMFKGVNIAKRTGGEFEGLGAYLVSNLDFARVKDSQGTDVLIARNKKS